MTRDIWVIEIRETKDDDHRDALGPTSQSKKSDDSTVGASAKGVVRETILGLTKSD